MHGILNCTLSCRNRICYSNKSAYLKTPLEIHYSNDLYDPNPNSIGYKIYWRRKELHLSKRDVMKMIGRNSTSLRRYEKGISVPSNEILGKLNNALGFELKN